MPVENRSRLTSGYGYEAWRGYIHNGVDFGGPSPGMSTKVYAIVDGIVTIAWDATVPKNSGKVIKIEHPDGSATIYVHTRNPRVKRGQHVKRGDWIAETWTTGISASAGIHLHLTWLKNANDYDSHFNPIGRLADYGWELDNSSPQKRLIDKWDGRSSKSVVTTVTQNTIATDAVVAPVVELEKELDLDKLEALIIEVQGLRKEVATLQNSVGGSVIPFTASNGNTGKTNQNGALRYILDRTLSTDNGVDEVIEILTPTPEEGEPKA